MTNTYDIVLYPDPVLKQVAQPIDRITDDIKKQAERMLQTMYEGGIGLAANQVGIANRLFVMDVDPACWQYKNDTDKVLKIESAHRNKETPLKQHPIVMINPKIVKKSERKSVYFEGCLSIPQQFADVERPAHVTVEYIDLDGHKQTMDASGLESHCIQHELDHLDGVLFIDYLSRLKRHTLVRKLEKYKKSEGLL